MSIFSRKRDLAYLVFFMIHLPIIFCIDLYPLYPDFVKFQFMHDVRKYYIETYEDQLFMNPPAWFTMYTWMEALYHVPLCIWAIGALLRDDPKVPIHLLMYAVQTTVTTATCIADYLSWIGFSNSQKIELGKLYVPYLALSVFMAVDMIGRLDASLSRKQPSADKKNF